MAVALRLALCLGLTLVPLDAAAASPSPSASPNATASGGGSALGTSLAVAPVDVAVVVDESGSISDTEMRQEQDAAALIGLGELSDQSKVTILGFGGADGDASGQNPIDQVCPLTEVNTTANRQYLGQCVGHLHTRTDAEGNNTDFVSAIDQGVSVLQNAGDPGRPKLLFLLTDGKLDVAGNPAYAGSPDQQNAAARAALAGQALPAAQAAGVQIWPLGFGPDTDMNQLEQIAAGGAQNDCPAGNGSNPTATPADPSELTQAVVTALASARCGQSGNSGPPISLAPGGSADLYVTVPAIATDGALDVVRQDPRIQVTFFDPNGDQVPTQGAFDGSTFSLSGADTPVESLSITDPLPGRWRVHLAAPAGVAGADVTAVVLWQSILRSAIIVDPPEPSPGQPVTVTVRLETRRAIVTGSAEQGLIVTAGLTGDGFSTPVTATLNDDGQSPDSTAGDGVFSGTLTVPNQATGKLAFVGRVSGPGVVGDERTTTTTIATGVPPLTVQIAFGQFTVQTGGTLHGTVLVANTQGTPRQVRLVLAGLNTTAPMSVSPPILSVPASGQNSAPITVSVGAPAGQLAGTLQVVDATTGQVYGQEFLSATVTQRPTWWRAHLGELIGAAVLILLFAVIAVMLAGRRRRARDVTGLTLLLYREGREVSKYAVMPPGMAPAHRFTIRGAATPTSRFDEPGPDDAVYVVRRARGAPGIVVTKPGGEHVPVQLRQTAPVAHDLSLGYLDDRADASASDHSGTTTTVAASRYGFDDYARGGDDRGGGYARDEYSGGSDYSRGDDYRGGDDTTVRVPGAVAGRYSLDGAYGDPPAGGESDPGAAAGAVGGGPAAAPRRWSWRGRRERDDATRPSPTYDEDY